MFNQTPTQSPYNSPQFRVGRTIYEDVENTSEKILRWVVSASEVLGAILKGFLTLFGIIAANGADIVMGSIGLSYAFSGGIATGYSSWIIPVVISLGASGAQLYLWNIIRRRGITWKLFWSGRMPNDIKPVMAITGFIWIVDTLMDISPIHLMIGTVFSGAWLLIMNICIYSLTIALCGFSEVWTSDIKGTLGLNE